MAILSAQDFALLAVGFLVVKRIRGVDLNGVIKELSSKVIKTGYFEHSKYEDGTPVAFVAMVQEEGSLIQNIPPRPTLRPSMAKNKQTYADALQRGVKASINGDIELNGVLEQIGMLSAGHVGEEIRSMNDPPLSIKTIQARARRASSGMASSKPLVDTGQMLQSVTSKVEDK